VGSHCAVEGNGNIDDLGEDLLRMNAEVVGE
jgi:hypothetical protein